MRLIDADNIYGAEDFIKLDKDFNAYVLLNDLCKIIDIQPTAYDVDKVVRQSEEIKHCINLYDDEMEVWISAIDEAIDIVKRGGNVELSEHSKSQGNRTGE